MSELINCAHRELIATDSPKLIPNPKNPNKHPDDQIERLAKIIAYQGQRSPVVISNLSGFITKGHGRLMAIKKLGWKQLAVDYQDYENEAQEYADIVADNAIAEWSDLDRLEISKQSLELGQDLTLDMLGLKDFEIIIPEVLDPQTDEDEVPEVVNPISKRGDVWLLGNHRLMCGDSTMIDDVEKLMNGEKADMVFTDPPYGVSYTGGLGDTGNGLESNKKEMIKNDDIDLYYEAVTTANQFSNGPVFMFHSDTVPFQLYAAVKDVGARVVALLVWKKKGGYGALGASYKNNYEPCLLWLPKGKKLNFIGESTETKIWEIDKDGLNKLHPTQKPVAVPKRAIANHDAKTVLDLFGGSGSTMIACEELKRSSRLMELDEKYCDVIINRWMNYTGRSDVKLESTGELYNDLEKSRI